MSFPNYALTGEPSDFRSLTYWLDLARVNEAPESYYDKAQIAANALLSFESKEEYLAWVAHWKAFYKPLAEQQRALKKEIHNPANHQPVLKTEHGQRWYDIPAAHFQSKISANKSILRALLYLRAEGKKKSWKLKQGKK